MRFVFVANFDFFQLLIYSSVDINFDADFDFDFLFWLVLGGGGF